MSILAMVLLKYSLELPLGIKLLPFRVSVFKFRNALFFIKIIAYFIILELITFASVEVVGKEAQFIYAQFADLLFLNYLSRTSSTIF